MCIGAGESVPEHHEHRRNGVAVQNRGHREYVAKTGGFETAKNQSVGGIVAVVVFARKAQTQDVSRGVRQAPAANGTRPECRGEAGRRFVVPFAVAHAERLEAKRRDFEHAESEKAVQLTARARNSVAYGTINDDG